MATKRLVMAGIGMALITAACTLLAGEAKPAANGQVIVIGTFDSRAVTIAYAHSEQWKQKLQQMQKGLDEAKSAGDMNKVKEIEQWGPANQIKFHMQGFGTADVSDILENIKSDIPGIAKEAGVDIIVSKWNIVYQNPSIKTVDITEKLIAPFKPDAKVLSIIKDLKSKQPISNDILEKMDPRE
jgi:Skp family chaperone for outer membrane proteins